MDDPDHAANIRTTRIAVAETIYERLCMAPCEGRREPPGGGCRRKNGHDGRHGGCRRHPNLNVPADLSFAEMTAYVKGGENDVA